MHAERRRAWRPQILENALNEALRAAVCKPIGSRRTNRSVSALLCFRYDRRDGIVERLQGAFFRALAAAEDR